MNGLLHHKNNLMLSLVESAHPHEDQAKEDIFRSCSRFYFNTQFDLKRGGNLC